MGYIAVKDLKRSRNLREMLERERELVLTRDGQPFALMVGISPDAVEESLNEVRRAMFSTAVMRARQRAASVPANEKEISNAISDSRKDRGLK